MDKVMIKLVMFLKKGKVEDTFEPVYIDPGLLSRDDFLEQCGKFWDDVEEFVSYQEG